MRDQRTPRHVQVIVAILCLVGILACSSKKGGSEANLVTAQGGHPVGFINTHIGTALASLNECKTCHGQDLAGGISKITCFTAACHHNPLPGWALPGNHGLRAKKAPDASGAGFASCQICHGAGFAAPLKAADGSNKACTTCHGVAAPHPAKPWRTTASTHVTTDPANAAVCVQCHFPGSPNNPSGHPTTPAPAGTQPGCYNATLCHAQAGAPHPLGSIWKDPTSAAFHGLEAKKDLKYCQSCHGTPGTPKFDGGTAPTACSSCHPTATGAGAHSTSWSLAPVVSFPGYVPSHRNAVDPLNASGSCVICHAVTKTGTSALTAAPSCYSATFGNAEHAATSCHANGPGQASHVLPFLGTGHTAVTQTAFNAGCASCHAVSGTSPTAAPLCTACHQGGSPFVQTNCTSCHSKPPVGTVFPDIAGVHAKHNALATVTGACGSCHQGSDTGSLAHYSAADGRPGHNSLRVPPGQVAFLGAFNASSGAATFNATDQTCSNVSCHGGQTTPSWATGGSINVATDCTKCHQVGTAPGLPQANSASSGFHALHMNSTAGLQCTECHAMANGSAGALAHFTTLNTAAMEGAASTTVVFTGGTYTAGSKTCTVTCHGETHASYTWSGTGGVHPVGWIASHPATALANVNACKACHGASLQGGPFKEPSCNTAACHHNTLPNYVLRASHGVRAKLAQGATGGGLASCQLCHGTNFATGLLASDGSTKACTTCHGVAAPHPAKPWHNAAGSNHATTDASNAPVCVQCHFPGSPSNPFGHPASPAPAGTAPGCFNNTMCHGPEAAPHVLGAIWTAATSSAFHGFQAKADLAACQSCHGTPGTTSFAGGTGATTKCTTCHTQGKAHADVWHDAPVATFPGYVASHRDAGNRAVACAICHDGTKGRTAPDLAAPSCFLATANGVACHVNGPGQPNHAIPFMAVGHTTVTQTAFNADCATCHAVSGTSPTAAPLCTACHQGGSPLTQSNCTSCHSKPPVGTVFPDIAGVHAKHNALATVTGACGSCHQGSDTGSLAHYSAADGRPGHNSLRVPPGSVAFLTAFNATSGAAAFNATDQTCSNVSCHGGQTTPSWATGGSINVATDCTKCHQVGTAPGLPQANSASSGFHALHMNSTAGLQCTECHAMANGSAGALAHFTTLNTAAMEGAASTTVVFTGGTYTAGSKTCTVTCHGETHASYTWSGTGGVHPVGWIASHPATALANVNACKACHGASLQGGPFKEPSCNTAACHHNTLPGYVLAGNHGQRAKQAQGATGGGLASCQLCHGTNFATGLLASDGSTKACTTCHGVAAPHPAKPWHNAAGSNHATTDGSNAPVCVVCHFPGSASNPAGHPATPAPAGTAPGCFNNTMCHGPEAAPHALGAVWTAATSSAFHGLQAKQDLAACQTCHGVPGTPSFAGGTGATTKCTTCHAQGKAHSDVWHDAPVATFPGYVASHRDAGNRAVACAICHDVTKGRTAPDLAAPSCFSATANGVACHVNGPGQPNHVVPFLDVTHTTVTQAGFDGNCGLCHAVSGASPSAAAPLCNACHQAASPLAVTACASCHVNPPAGSAFPNVAGSHAKHNGLANLTGICAACHQNTVSGTLTHYTHADGRPGHDSLRLAPGEVATDPSYNSKAGTATFNPADSTCSNVSCHGGQITPSWLNGTLAANTEAGCRACHALGSAQGAPENNSPYSGLHALHLNSTQNLQCVECHNMANGTTGAQNHFKFLNTAAMEGPAGQTVAFTTTTPAATYTIATQACGSAGAFSCHGHAHGASYTWLGGGSHSVPYTGSAHTGVTSQAAFDASCKNCHGVSGSSPNASAPLCITCHQAGSPLTLANCTSCHAKPPVGSAFPDVAGKHALHESLAGVTGQCATCHTGAEPGNSNNVHYDHANARPGKNALRVEPGQVAFLTTYNAKGITATFDPATLTCSNVSCHGGLQTPNWRTGSIAVITNAGCLACHTTGTAQGLPQDNSAYSGLHAFHLSAPVSAQCTECHSMTNGSPGALNHFKFLGTTATMEGPASDTIALAGDNASIGTYTVSGQVCTVTCHGQSHAGFKWAGGANHPVPYPDAAHTAVTTTAFNANCKTCHGDTAASSMAAAPSCVTCHTAGSPLTVTNCASCHTRPPTGASFPNVAGKHAKHNALPELTNSCVDCHSGLEPGNANRMHYDHANNRPGLNALRVAPGEVAFAGTTYNAKTGAAAFNSATLTCSNVSCHGGQSVAWTATITVNTQCTACHTTSGTTQYNSPSSGQHSRSNHVSAGCVACHDTTKLATSHFVGLKTTAIDTTAARNSLIGPTTKLLTYNVTTRQCTSSCHGTQTW